MELFKTNKCLRIRVQKDTQKNDNQHQTDQLEAGLITFLDGLRLADKTHGAVPRLPTARRFENIHSTHYYYHKIHRSPAGGGARRLREEPNVW